MYNVSICEDNKLQLLELERILKIYGDNEQITFNIDKFCSGEDIINAGFDKYDFIMLDINLGGINGIDVAKIIRKSNEDVKIIFITAIEKYWPEGYNVNAFRYILKPINDTRFYIEIKNLINEINKNKIFITTNNDGDLKTISIQNIRYLEILSRKVMIHTQSGTYSSNYSLRYWNKKLYPYGFANPHSSYLVNLRYVKGLSKEKVVLINDDVIYVSQRKYKEFKDKFIKYIGEI